MAETAAPRTWQQEVFTWPNLISVIRLGCIPIFVWLLLGDERRMAAAGLLAVLGATDWVDGWIARRFDQTSEVGKILDPTADRLMFLVAVFSMIIDESVPLWFAVLTLVREADWVAICKAISREGLANDARFKTFADRAEIAKESLVCGVSRVEHNFHAGLDTNGKRGITGKARRH